MKPKIVFVCSYAVPLQSTVVPLCQSLQAAGELEPVVLLERDRDESLANICRQASIGFEVLSRAPAAKKASSANPTRSTVTTIRQPRAVGPLQWTMRVVGNVVSVAVKIRRLTKQLAAQQAKLLVLLDDRTISACRWIRAAEIAKIPVLVIQWAASHDEPTMVAVRSVQRGSYRARRGAQFLERQVASLIPDAVRTYDGRDVWWCSADQALSHWLCGAFPRSNTWVFGGGNANQVAMMGNAWKERAVSTGVAPDRLVVTGHPEQDTWYALRERWSPEDTARVAAELGLDPSAKIVSIIAPALCFREPGGNREGDLSRATLEQDLQHVVAGVQRLGPPYVPVVKVHPRDRVQDYAFLRENKPQSLHITRDADVRHLLAASHVMACQWSSTAMLAQALGTAVIVFDFHGSPSAAMWQGVEALQHAASPAEFDRVLANYLLNEHGQLAKEQHREAFVNHYLRVDGAATERLLDMIHQQARLPLRDDLRKSA